MAQHESSLELITYPNPHVIEFELAHYPPQRLRTENPYTTLELLTPNDADEKFFYEQTNATHLARYNMGSNCDTVEQVYDNLLSIYALARNGLLAPYKIVHQGLYLGEVCMSHSESESDGVTWISWHIGESWQGRRIAKHSVSRAVRFAFEGWDSKAVQAGIRPSNLSSQRLAKSVGFSPTTRVDEPKKLRIVPDNSSETPNDSPIAWTIPKTPGLAVNSIKDGRE